MPLSFVRRHELEKQIRTRLIMAGGPGGSCQTKPTFVVGQAPKSSSVASWLGRRLRRRFIAALSTHWLGVLSVALFVSIYWAFAWMLYLLEVIR